jgi:hypothetical protein
VPDPAQPSLVHADDTRGVRWRVLGVVDQVRLHGVEQAAEHLPRSMTTIAPAISS